MRNNDIPTTIVISGVAGFLLGTVAWSYDDGTIWSDVAAGWFQAIASVAAIAFATWLPWKLARDSAARDERSRSQEMTSLRQALCWEMLETLDDRAEAVSTFRRHLGLIGSNTMAHEVLVASLGRIIRSPTLAYSANLSRLHLLDAAQQDVVTRFYAVQRRHIQACDAVLDVLLKSHGTSTNAGSLFYAVAITVPPLIGVCARACVVLGADRDTFLDRLKASTLRAFPLCETVPDDDAWMDLLWTIFSSGQMPPEYFPPLETERAAAQASI